MKYFILILFAVSIPVHAQGVSDSVLRLLQTSQCPRCDLTGADLSDHQLAEADLEAANLTNANLSDTYLRGADLRNTILKGAIISETKLAGQTLKRLTWM